MGLLTKNAIVKWNNNNKKWYESKGYIFTKMKDEFEVKVKDLSNGSHVFVDVKCDCVDCKNPYLKPIFWYNYLRYIKNDNKYYCQKCVTDLFARDKMKQTRLKNSQSFEQWCIENNRQDVLDRWDFILNNCLPSEVLCSTHNKYYFKCEKGIHKSELKNIGSFTYGHKGSINCKMCNSLGFLCQQAIQLWSDKNSKTSYDYQINSHQEAWWKCPCGKHDDYLRRIDKSNRFDFRCPECNYSQGEKQIENYFISYNFIKDEDYIPQKTFEGLVGIGNGLLSYDFYLPNHNLLIEYQGEFHDGTARQQSREDFIIQQEHDRRKKQYCIDNNIKLLEIWYWDFDNIETILKNELSLF